MDPTPKTFDFEPHELEASFVSPENAIGRVATDQAIQVVEITETIDSTSPSAAPEGWKNTFSVTKEVGRNYKTVKVMLDQLAEANPDGTIEALNSQGKRIKYFAPELTDIAHEMLSKVTPQADDFISINDMSEEVGVSAVAIRKFIARHQGENLDTAKYFVGEGGQNTLHIATELADEIRHYYGQYQPLPNDVVGYRELTEELGISNSTLRNLAGPIKQERPKYFATYRTARGRSTAEYFHINVANQLRQLISEVEQVPSGWETLGGIANRTGFASPTISNLCQSVRLENPEFFKLFKGSQRGSKGRITEYIHPDAITLMEGKLSGIEAPPEQWKSVKRLSSDMGISRQTLQKIIEPLRERAQENFRFYRASNGRVAEYLNPDVAEEVMRQVEREKINKLSGKVYEVENELLKIEVSDFLIEVSVGKTLESQDLQKLIQLFGAERAVDILFQYRPKYRKIDVPYVRSVIGEYLGDFLSLRPDLNLEDLEDGVQYLAEPSLKAGLTEVIKNDCLSFYNQHRWANPTQPDLEIFALYIDYLRSQTSEYSTAELGEVIDEVASYFNSLLEITRPDNLVDQLSDGRLFPDVNQRINIKELELKQKMLIADEMGVGKSASAILAKEYLGINLALIVVPSNVIEVWQKYLSDQKSDDGVAEGYFKEGQAPRVLIVESLLQIKNVNPADYDYVILSQERLTSPYVEALEKFNYGMLIVDEVHKLKNISQGKRAENLIDLAALIEQGDATKYLALLSGTPVPNKVGDVAMILRLLYPEKFEHISNQELTRQILKGDMLDLRSLLVPRMEMKSLTDSIEMPRLKEELHVTDMSDKEKAVYEILLEEDELTASHKIQILRQFLLNPAISEVTPDIQSSKLSALGAQLHQTYSNKNKVVMFVNDYIEGVIRGQQTIFDQMELPEQVETLIIDGETPKHKRVEAQRALSDPNRKILLVVSGQTADVGVDFSGAQEVIFYNEPWTSYDKKQQQGRVWRPGLKDDLVSRTYYTRGTIEEGIHRYTEVKHQAIEKLLRGIPLSELEHEMLKSDEKESSPDLDVNPALAEHYFSAWDRLMKIFNYVKEIGETDFVEFKNRYGQEYARCYTELGSRSYQANVNRLAGSIVDKLNKERGQDSEFSRIVDIASGPEMLKKHIPDEYQQQIVSVDINPHHFEKIDDKRRIGSFLNLPVADSTMDYANLALGLHYTKFLPSKQNYERLEVFKELNRVLVNEGIAVISQMHSLDLKYPDIFRRAVEKMGFKFVEQYTGVVEAGSGFRTHLLVLQKVSDCPADTATLVRALGSELLHGFKFTKNRINLRDSRLITTKFTVGGKTSIEARLNSVDSRVFEEEQAIIALAKQLKKRFGDVRHIPREQIEEHGFTRAKTGQRYALFKPLETSTGAVVAR